jgi:hypothetical protein
MLTRSLTLVRNSIQMAVLTALLWVGHSIGFSAEPTHSSKQALTNKPADSPEKKNILSFRAYRPSESDFRSPSLNVPAPAIPPSATPSPRTSRQEREFLDRQKNWIFVLPGDDKTGDSAEDILGVEPTTFDEGKSKSVVTKFLENRREDLMSGANGNGNKNDSKNFAEPQIFGVGNEKPNAFGAWGQLKTGSENLPGNHGAQLSLAERWQELHGPQSEKAREEKRVRMNEFEQLFNNSQSVSAGNGGLTILQNNLSPASSASASSDLNILNRNSPASPSGLRNLGSLSGPNPSTQPGINTRVFGSSAAPASIPQPRRTVTQPAVLPIPKRHF